MRMFRIVFSLLLILDWCDLFAVMMGVFFVCLHAYICYCLYALDSNDIRYSKEGKVFGYQGEDQGQAEKGKPSKLDSYLILVLLIACFINVYKIA
jgi:hypothetical protein